MPDQTNRREFLKGIAMLAAGTVAQPATTTPVNGYDATSSLSSSPDESELGPVIEEVRVVPAPLLNTVEAACARLAPLGWHDLLLAHGLDITASNLKEELTKPLEQIDRSIPGFNDFSLTGRQGITSGRPSESLLYHAFASPYVKQGKNGKPLASFPTLAEIEAVENLVFGVAPPSLAELKNRVPNATDFAVVVFAYEYRPRFKTVHRQHADLCFARTGISRIGNTDAFYDEQQRGFRPIIPGDGPHTFRVVPARYGAFIAARLSGDENSFGPAGFQKAASEENQYKTDITRKFWVPLHKLFNGIECLQGMDLTVSLEASHVNEKLRRVHLAFGAVGEDTGWHGQAIHKSPFVIRENIAELSIQSHRYGSGLLIPVKHQRLVEAAQYRNVDLTYSVPKSYVFPDQQGENHVQPPKQYDDVVSNYPALVPWKVPGAPEYIDSKHVKKSDGSSVNLNLVSDRAIQQVTEKEYRAQHFVDYTGDGGIEVQCSALENVLPTVAAYSIVAPPDFFPYCDQADLRDWTEHVLPAKYQQGIWTHPPSALSDVRSQPNLQLDKPRFRQDDSTDSVTALVSLLEAGPMRTEWDVSPTILRQSYLPDASPGKFAPGWDIGKETKQGLPTLSGFVMASPFISDVKLCAALSSFWPAVAPDSTRTFRNNSQGTVLPLTDEELGIVGSGTPWDGIAGPKVVIIDGEEFVEYKRYDRADYLRNAIDNRLSMTMTSKIDFAEYVRRIYAMVRVWFGISSYQPLTLRPNWKVLSFSQVTSNHPDVREAEQSTGSNMNLAEYIYRFELCEANPTKILPMNSKYPSGGSVPQVIPHPTDVTLERVLIQDRRVVLVDSDVSRILKKQSGTWKIGFV